VPGFEQLGESELYRGHTIWVGKAEIKAPDGRHNEREIVHHPGAVSVVPLLDDGRAVLVRQYRAPVGMELLEIPAGKRDVEGEDPIVTAQRELAEEVGLQAEHVELLVEFYNSPGFCDEHSFAYLATGLTETDPAPVGVEEQFMQIEYVALDDVPTRIKRGELVDAKSIIALLAARERVAGR
jgi:ADP-ribose pyrophosphatase